MISVNCRWLGVGLMLLAVNTIDIAYAQTAHKEEIAGKKQAMPAMSHQRGAKKLVLVNAEGAVVTLWKPDLSTRPLTAKMGRVTLPPTGMDNYHAVVVERDWGRSFDALVRYEYLRGKPSGESPRKLTTAVKTPLEIVPDPIPREHHRYYSGAEAGFIVRYRQQPLANQAVTLQTSHGSLVTATSDDVGRVVLTIPDDFPDVIAGQRDLRSAELSIQTEYQADAVHYTSALTAAYRLSPEHWQSKPWGFAVAGAGFIFGGLVTRRVARNKGRGTQ
ncbi:hypothetical protein [Sedimenticola sp.]|uniref:hypothetical protein n=1 Tax=Sedimenticola sp. TaxID=1940285 RepID=UPI003D12103D